VGDSVDIEAARIPDRDRLLQELQEAGLEARAVGEVEIEVQAGEAGEIYEQVEGMIMSLGAPFVPIRHEGVIYVRPPVG
jgi:predicted SpoU family rRNA methylase